ncbi:DUF6614 family protein [Leisingera sp. JC11]
MNLFHCSIDLHHEAKALIATADIGLYRPFLVPERAERMALI